MNKVSPYKNCLANRTRIAEIYAKYKKAKRYFTRTNLYKYLTENSDLERAMSNSEKLCQLCKESSEDLKAYSEIHKIIELLNKLIIF